MDKKWPNFLDHNIKKPRSNHIVVFHLSFILLWILIPWRNLTAINKVPILPASYFILLIHGYSVELVPSSHVGVISEDTSCMWREGEVLEPKLSISAGYPILFVIEYANKINEEQEKERERRGIRHNNM